MVIFEIEVFYIFIVVTIFFVFREGYFRVSHLKVIKLRTINETRQVKNTTLYSHIFRLRLFDLRYFTYFNKFSLEILQIQLHIAFKPITDEFHNVFLANTCVQQKVSENGRIEHLLELSFLL